MSRKNRNLSLAATIATALAALGAGTAEAITLPPASFTYNVVTFGGSTCPGSVNTATDGTCGGGSNVAWTDGGVPGTPGYGLSPLPGTAVYAGASAPDGASIGVTSLATMTYYFSVGGPAVPGGQIAVDVISDGSASLSGGTGLSIAALVITNDGTTPGTPIGGPGSIVDDHYDAIGCLGGLCGQTGAAWNQPAQIDADHLCLTQGDVYAITITASASALGKGANGTASVDPKIVVDPQGPTDPTASCYQPADPTGYGVNISAGASTGVPEPGTLGLMGLGLLAIGLNLGLGRRSRAKA
jgi:hypothetical protein